MRTRLLASWLVLLVSILVGPANLPGQDKPAEAAVGDATIDQATLPVAGRQAATFRVPTFGRWSVALASERGVALQLVDRVNGPGDVVGTAGEVDGRLDVFLDRGEYKVVSHGIDGVTTDLGAAKLTVQPFREVEERAVTLPDLAEVETELGDLQQVSWWIQLPKKRRVAFEAAGRHLEDFRLWRDGTWMVGKEPSFEQVEPAVGRPLTIARLVTELPPGLYRLTAYGGAGLPWADDDGSRPLYLRSGVPKRGEAGRSRLEVSRFGIDRFVVPASASVYRLEVPGGDLRGESVTLEVDGWNESTPFDAGDSEPAVVHKELRELAVEEFRTVDEKRKRVITVRGPSGQPYVLQHFRSELAYRFDREGEYWIDTVHTGHPADAVEATAMLFDLRAVTRYAKPLRAEVVRLRPESALHRKFNLHERATLFLEVVARADYELRLDGVDADVRLEPYVLPWEKLEERPPERRLRAGETSSWELDPGYYVLTLEPESQGIADLTLAATGVEVGTDLGASPTARLGRVFLHETSYLLHQNEKPGIHSGVVLRPLPLDLSEPLPFVLSGTGDRSSLTVPFRVPGPGYLRAVAEDGSELPLRVESDSAPPDMVSMTGIKVAPPGRAQQLVEGKGKVTVSAPGDLELPVAVSLFWEPKHRRDPLPELPAGTLDALPKLPVLTSNEEQILKLGRNDRETFLVRAENAALYRLESTGLLDTRGVLRTRVVPNLESVDDEGTGRNFRVQRYLGAGEYQLTVSTRGRSAGTLGVRLAAAPVRPAGRLEADVAARGWIDPDESLEYRFTVQEAGTWRVRVLGLGGLFPVRIEDADGWPMTRPGRPGDQLVELEEGEYRLVVLPQAVRARHVALVSRIPDAPERSGHGPFDLALGVAVAHRWEEPSDSFRALVDGESDLPPDRWRLDLTAPVDLRFDLGRDVVADVVDATSGESIGRATSLRGLDEAVPAGEYEVHVRPARRNNRVEYDLKITPVQLLPGYATNVPVPGTYELRVGESSLAEIVSFGDLDVRARLLGPEGDELAQSDDRPGDWNLRLVRRLEPGEYRLDLAQTGQGGSVNLAVSTLEEVEEAALQLSRSGDFSATLVPGKSVHLWSLDPWHVDSASPGNVLMAQAESAEGLRLTVESRSSDGTWRSVAWGEGTTARLAYAPAAGEPLRLRLEALDRGSSQVRVRVRWSGLDTVDEERLARGVRLPDTLGGRGVVAVRLDRPGCFDVRDLPSGSRVAGFESTALRSVPDLASGGELLLIESASGSAIRARRWQWPEGGEPRRLRLLPGERATCDLEASDAPRLLSARGLGGQATLTVGEGGAQAADGSEALALALARTGSASIALERAGGLEPADVELCSRGFVEGPPRGAEERIAGQVADGESWLYVLPVGGHRLRMTLGTGVTAAVTSGRRVEMLHRAFGSSAASGVELVRDVQVDEAGDAYLRLMAPTGGPGLFEVSVLQHTDGQDSVRLGVGRPFERRLDRAGRIDLPVEAGDAPIPLFVRGADRVTLLAADGSVSRSEGPTTGLTAPAGGGRLVIEHGPGAVIAWLGSGVNDLVESASGPVRERLDLPSVRRVSGDIWTGQVDLMAPRVLHLRAALSAVAIVDDAASLHPDDLALNVWLPAGRSVVTLRSLAGESLDGELEATESDVVEVGEGLGPEILLAPGGERWVSFRVERAGRIGVAVRAASEVVAVRLLDAGGHDLPGTGGGALHLADLAPGRYLMALSLASDQPPVRVRPVVVGLEQPTGPPDDVVRKYLALASEPDLGSEP